MGQHGPAPQAAPARVLQVLLLQWCWQQPTWQAAACTHCSLLFVHCQGKGAGGRAEGEEGAGNYKDQQEQKIIKVIAPETAAGVQRNVHLLPAHSGSVTPRKYLHSEQHTAPEGSPAALAVPRVPLAQPGGAGPVPRPVPPRMPIHRSGRRSARTHRLPTSGGRERKIRQDCKKGGKTAEKGG